MPEVAGGAALCIDPMDIEQIADAMERVTENAALARSLRERGIERARQFSWAHTAQEMLALYKELLSEPLHSS
jgi:glycosyltransferase involved in cell wall biosynthesis